MRRLHSKIRPAMVVHLLVVSLVCGGAAHAQIKHNDYTTMSSQFGSQTVQPIFYGPGDIPTSGNYNSRFVGKLPEINESLSSRQVKMSMMDTKYSPLNNQMTDETLWQKMFNSGETKQPTMFKQPDTRRPTMSDVMQKDAPLNKYTNYDQQQRPSGVSKYEDAYVFHTAPNNDPMDMIGRELSMQDINRYQFHSSNSSEPGLPVTHAGDSGNQPEFDSNGLGGTPRLFDFSPSQTSTKIRSGGAVAPRVVTPAGTQQYLATRQNTLGRTALTASGSGRTTLADAGASSVVSHGNAHTEYVPSMNGDKQIPVQYGPYELSAEER